MRIVYGLVGIVIGAVLTWVYLLDRKREEPRETDQRERELKAVLDEIRELRTELDILKVNPTIGDAVKAALDFARQQPDFQRSGYDVIVRPGKLPASAYNVAARPGPLSEGEPRA